MSGVYIMSREITRDQTPTFSTSGTSLYTNRIIVQKNALSEKKILSVIIDYTDDGVRSSSESGEESETESSSTSEEERERRRRKRKKMKKRRSSEGSSSKHK